MDLGLGLAFLLCIASALPPRALAQGGASGPERWRLVLDLRYEDGPATSLTRVRAIAAGAEGRLYVADAGSPGVLAFGADGRHRATIGSEGEGPGEFRSVWSLGTHGDTLWVTDARLGRASFFGPDGRYLRSVNVLQHLDALPGLRSPVVHGAVSTDAFFVIGVRGERTAHEAVFLRVSPETGARRIGSLEVEDRWYVVELPGRGSGGSSDHQPFGFYDQFALSPDGKRFIVLKRDAVQRDRAEYAVELHDAFGRQEGTVAVPYEPRERTDEEVERWLDTYMERGITEAWLRAGLFPGRRALRDAARRALDLEESVPPTSNRGGGIRDAGILIGREGRILVQRFEAPGVGGRRWDVIDPERGERVAVLAVPGDLELVAADGRWAWGVTRDAYDVPSLRRFRIEEEPSR